MVILPELLRCSSDLQLCHRIATDAGRFDVAAEIRVAAIHVADAIAMMTMEHREERVS